MAATLRIIEILIKIIRLTLISLIVLSIIVSCAGSKKPVTEKYQFDYPEELGIVTREDWGSVDLPDTMKQHKLDRITIHHSGVEFTEDENVIEYLRNLQSWSRSEKKWIDSPYHYLIDLDGKIYEGRKLKYPGDTNTTYDPTGHLLINVIGNYEIQKISKQQLDKIADLIAYFIKEFDLKIDSIKGHKDYADTACPGKDLYQYLQDGTIVKMVNERLY